MTSSIRFTTQPFVRMVHVCVASARLAAIAMVVAVSALLAWPRAAAAATCDQFTCTTMHDIVPNFAGQPTIRSTRTGAWSSSATWNLGRVPTASDTVAITGGTTVTVDGTSAVAAVVGIEPSGRLAFTTSVNTRLTVGTLQILPQGALEIGTPSAPVPAAVTAEVVIADRALDLTDDGVGVFDPRQFGTGILSIDGKVTMAGAVKTTFQRLATEPRTGDVTLQLAAPVSGWMVGDRIFLPDSKHVSSAASSYTYEGEERTVAAVSTDGLTVTLSAALSFNHPGARDGNDVLEFLPHVGNLSRNIIIRSENPAGTRGHAFFTERSEVDVEYASLRNLGRTTVDPLDSTTFDSSGNVLHMGTNQIGRYPMHFHHVIGPTSLPANGHQFTILGNAIDDDATINRRKWAMTIHASHYGLISQNVIYNAGGWGIGTEDGSESFNEFSSNFIARVRGEGNRESSEAGNGLWFRGPNNYVRDNVVANVRGNQIEGAHGIQFYFKYLGTICVPNFPGGDPHTDCTSRNGNQLPLLEFARNEVYGASEIGLAMWWLGTNDFNPLTVAPSTVLDFRVWNFTLYGFYGYPAAKLTFDGYVARGKKSYLSNVNEFVTGFWVSDYMLQDLVIRRADIQNLRYGIIPPYFSRGSTLIENSYLRNAVNIQVRTIGAAGSQPYGPNMPAKQTIISNVTFAAVNGSVGGWGPIDIDMSYTLWNGSANLIKRDAVYVYGYNKVAGDDFQVFYTQQDPNFIVPQSSGNLAGSPVAGLTNAQNWATYGIAIAGEVATNVTTRPLINGFVRLGAPQLLPSPPTITTVTPTQSTLSVAFIPGNSGTASITNYEYSLNGGATWVTRSPAAVTSPIAIAGLTPGTAYSVRLRAVNANGQSTPGNQVVVSTVPLAPLAVTLSPQSTSVLAGTPITFTASVSGGTGPFTYQFWVYDGSSWRIGQSWSGASTWTWCPPRGGSYNVQVWVRNAGSTGLDAWAWAQPTIASPSQPTVTCITPSDPAATAGTPVTWTLTADGGVAPYSFRFFTFDGARWSMQRDWSTANTVTWTPPASGTYGLQVWARNAGSSAPYDMYRDGTPYTAGRPSRVTLTSVLPNVTSPVPAGTPVTWTAMAAGGVRPFTFKFSVYDGVQWTLLQDWSSANTVVWQPAHAGTYMVQAWVRNAGSTSTYDDTRTSATFTVTAPSALTVRSLTADRSLPVPARTPVRFTAAAVGGTGPYTYQFWLFNGTSWTIGQSWSASDSWTWVPPAAGTYQVQAWVRNAGSTRAYDGWTALAATVIPAAPLATPTVTMSPRSVLPAGEPTTFTVSDVGGAGPYTYQFWLYNGTSWSIGQAWSASNTWTWTPSAPGTYALQVWIKNAGSTALLDSWQGLTPIVITP